MKLGRYEILRHLATGGMAEVLLARTTGIQDFERYFVLKRIRADQARDHGFVQMFLDEARLAASLHHHSIVQVHEVGQDQGEYFFAMEYIHGEDLRMLLRAANAHKAMIPLDHAVAIVIASASALHYAHEYRGPSRESLGIVHRDVSPANILVSYEGDVKVVDFGIAKAALKTTKTQTGALKGKVSYMAPEQCAGRDVDRRSDIFALGIVLYELVTARRLFKGENDFLTMTAIVHGTVPRPSLHRRDLPPELEQIILRALAQLPEDRYQTAEELRSALEQFSTRSQLRTTATALAGYMRQQFGHRPEPWLVENSETEIPIPDYDGSASGVARAPTESMIGIALPDDNEKTVSSPIMEARERATPFPSAGLAMGRATRSSAPMAARASSMTSTEPLPPSVLVAAEAQFPSAPLVAPGKAKGSRPMHAVAAPTSTIDAIVPPGTRRRQNALLGVAVVAALLVGVAIGATRGGGGSPPAPGPPRATEAPREGTPAAFAASPPTVAQPAAAAVPPAVPAVDPTTPPTPAPTTTPTTPPTAPTMTTDPTTARPADPPTDPEAAVPEVEAVATDMLVIDPPGPSRASPPRRTPTPPPRRKVPKRKKPAWDPNSLFPE